jgi:hypothetical protein
MRCAAAQQSWRRTSPEDEARGAEGDKTRRSATAARYGDFINFRVSFIGVEYGVFIYANIALRIGELFPAQ